ncbi:MAG: T9SS type A sorting domain-containing protein [Saprospiraceae bacterium]|nr:T9SS type A sorting domain-containing protein [Lewinella sp.]
MKPVIVSVKNSLFTIVFVLFAAVSLPAQFAAPQHIDFDPPFSFNAVIYDLDGDKDLDMVTRNDHVVNYYINRLEEGKGWEAHEFNLPEEDKLPLYYQVLERADLDGDGLDDLLYFGGSEPDLYLTWFSFDATSNQFTPHEKIPFFSYYECTDRIYIYPLDWDGDGDIDLLFNRGWQPFIAINSDGNGTLSLNTEINELGCHSLEDVRDFDKDGLPDIYVGVEGPVAPGVYRNQGDATFSLWNPITIDENIKGKAHFINDSITYHLNRYTSDQTYITGQIVENELVFRAAIPAEGSALFHDFDKDGTDEKIRYFYTNYPEPQQFEYSAYNAENFLFDKGVNTFDVQYTSIRVFDYNQDGWDDLLIENDGPIFWMENLFGLPRISGVAYLDYNGNGQRDANEVLLRNAMISSPQLAQTFYTNEKGEYTIFAEPGTYQISADIAEENIRASTTEAVTVILGNSDQLGDIDFAFEFIDQIKSLDISLINNSPRCNTDTRFNIIYKNTGTTITSGSILLQIDENTGFVSASPTPSNTTGQTISWTFSDLAPFQQDKISLTLAMPSATFINDTLVFQTTIEDDQGDAHAMDEVRVMLRCSYDPNDKQVDPPGSGPEHLTLLEEEVMEYLIRFQNTGNDTAFDVRITDELHPLLDINTFQVIDASHTYRAEIEGRMLSFFFDDILLPDSTTNLAGSQGYIQFRINAQAGIQPGDQITNEAQIYFDANAPIITNEVFNTFTDFICSDFHVEVQDYICEGETYEFGTQLLSANGVYMETFESSTGCDSMVTLILSVLPALKTTIDAQICEGETFQFDGQELDEAGTYTVNLTSNLGCDSTVTLNISVLPDIIQGQAIVLCDGESYPLGEQTLTASGTYSETFTADNGCDSTQIIELTVRNAIRTSIDAQICAGQEFEGYGETGMYLDMFTSTEGCDSLRTLILQVLPADTTVIDTTICAGNTFMDFSETGSYTLEQDDPQGCISYQIINLQVQDYKRITLDTTLCPGDSLYTYGESGIYLDTLYDQGQCGTIRTVQLNYLSSETSECVVAAYDLSETDISLYPNPARNLLKIRLKGAVPKPLMLSVLDAQGHELLHRKEILQESIELSTESWPNGIYFLHLNYAGRSAIKKVIKLE